ncbi:MAG: hypothetical protein JJ952_19465, partial [Pseudomonadales bacterium]|nr:hypothetical protein [Pseudomonadales bacterium]
MPRKFTLDDDEFDIPSIDWLELNWGGAANRNLAREIGFQEQFRKLFRFTFSNLRSVPAENPGLNPIRLSLSVRAGVLKTYVLLTVSIAEGALSALGEERNLGRREGELYDRTFGQLLGVWKENEEPRPEVAAIWD